MLALGSVNMGNQPGLVVAVCQELRKGPQG